MRILFFSNVFPNPLQPTKGPFNLAMVRALGREHDVHVVSPIGWVDELRGCLRRGAKVAFGKVVSHENHSVEFVRSIYPPGILRSSYGECLEWSAGKTLDRRIAEFGPDAVVSYWVHPDGDVAVRAAHRAGVPAVVMTGGSDVLVYGRQGARREKMLRVLHDADAIVPVSQNLADVLEADGIDPGKLHVVHRGVDREVFHPGNREAARLRLGLPNDRPMVIAVGRLVPVKGFDILIRAVERLCRSGFPIDCHILGAGELHGELTAGILRRNLSDHVFLQGATKQNRLPDWYRAADLTVLSSHSEGIPNVLLESICCGTPFVATNVGGVSEIADERLHRLVPPGDEAALAGAIRESLDAAKVPGSAGLESRFVPSSWSESSKRICSLIETCCRQSMTTRVPEGAVEADESDRTEGFTNEDTRELAEVVS